MSDNVLPLPFPTPERSYTPRLGGSVDVRELLGMQDDIAAPIAFGSDRWDLAGHPAWKNKVGDQTVINFSRIPRRWKAIAKEWALAALNPVEVLHEFGVDTDTVPVDVFFGEAALPVTVQGNVKQLSLVLRRLDAANLHHIAHGDWDQVTAAMRTPLDRDSAKQAKTVGTRTCIQQANQLIALHRFGPAVGWELPFGSEPWDGDLPSAVFKQAGSERAANSTRPHEAVGHILGLSGFIIDQLATDIVAHTRWWVDTRHSQPLAEDRAEARARYSDIFGELAARHGGRIPATRRPDGGLSPAHMSIGYLLGIDQVSEAVGYDCSTAVSNAGLTRAEQHADEPFTPDEHLSVCPLPIAALPHHSHGDPVPWAPRLLWDRRELHWWISALLYSCAFYLQATIGLRDQDRDLLAVGCVRPRQVTDSAGHPTTVWELHGWKQKQRTIPIPTVFPVGERVRRAVTVLEELHAALGNPAGTITELPGGDGIRLFDSALNLGSVRGGRDAIHLDLSYMRWFRQAAERLHRAGVVPRDLSDVEDVTAAQIRITALQSVAARPLGQALAAAYGQWSSQRVMHGYVGDVARQIVFIPEHGDGMEAARNEARGRHLVHAAQVRDAVNGNGVERLDEALARHPELSNPTPLTASTLKRMGKRQANLAVSPWTLCIYQDEGALCGGHGAADFRLCRPGECRNSAQTQAQRAAMELRRRTDLRLHPFLARDAHKIAEGLPNLEAEFAELSDDDLVALIDDDIDAFVRAAVKESR